MVESRVAVLVLAANAPEVLKYQIASWPNAMFFVHLDSKADQNRFSFLSDFSNVKLADERLPIFWGGWNMVRAEIELMRAARKHGYNRLVLISDDSFMLRTTNEIEASICDDSSHIGIWSMPETDPAFIRYKEFFYFDSRAMGLRTHNIYDRFITNEDTVQIADLASFRLRGKANVPIFKGGQWWCLTSDVADYILRVHDEDEHLRQSFRFSLIPDEHFIHTIIGLSPTQFSLSSNPMWTEIERNPSPWVFSSVDELRPALDSGYLFVRKVAPVLAHELYETFR